MKKFIFYSILLFLPMLSGCYSFTGAAIDGKTINIHLLENRAMNVVPSLSSALNEKIRSRIISQTGLAPVNNIDADYDINGAITAYNVSIAGISGSSASTNRLTITVEINFKNKLKPKDNFKQSFSRFADFSASQQLQSVESSLIDDIGSQLADDIFNKAFVNW